MTGPADRPGIGKATGPVGDPRVREVVERAPALSAELVERLRHLLPGVPAADRDSDAA